MKILTLAIPEPFLVGQLGEFPCFSDVIQLLQKSEAPVLLAVESVGRASEFCVCGGTVFLTKNDEHWLQLEDEYLRSCKFKRAVFRAFKLQRVEIPDDSKRVRVEWLEESTNRSVFNGGHNHAEGD